MALPPEEVILKGAAAWNKWQEENKFPPHFARPSWYECRDERGLKIKGRNELDFSGIHLTNASVHLAFAEGLNMRNAEVVGCHFEEGDFSRADFSNTIFINTTFNKTILTDANFEAIVADRQSHSVILEYILGLWWNCELGKSLVKHKDLTSQPAIDSGYAISLRNLRGLERR